MIREELIIMVFKRIEKGHHLIGLDPMQVSVIKSGFSIGRGLSELFINFNCAEVFFDNEKRLVGLKPTNNMLTGFKLNKKGRSYSLLASHASKRLVVKKYDGRIEDGMVVFNVLEIAEE